MTIGEITED